MTTSIHVSSKSLETNGNAAESKGNQKGYTEANATLRALYEERMQRDHARHWDAPESFELGSEKPPLRLCSLPGRYLGAQVWLSGHILARFIAAGHCRALALE